MFTGMNSYSRVIMQWAAIVLLAGLLLWQLSGCSTPEAASQDAGICQVTIDGGIDPCSAAISHADLQEFRESLTECVQLCECESIMCPPGMTP